MNNDYFSLGIVNMDGKTYVKHNNEDWKEVDEKTYTKLNDVVGKMFGSTPVKIGKVEDEKSAGEHSDYYHEEFYDKNHKFVDTLSSLDVYTNNQSIVPRVYFNPTDYIQAMTVTIPNPYVYVKKGDSDKVFFLSLDQLRSIFDKSAANRDIELDYVTAALGTDDMDIYIYDIRYDDWRKLRYIYFVNDPCGYNNYMLYVDGLQYTVYSKHSTPYTMNNVTPYHIMNADQYMMNIHCIESY